MTRITIHTPEDLIARIDARIAKIDDAVVRINAGTLTTKQVLIGLCEDAKDQWLVMKKILDKIT